MGWVRRRTRRRLRLLAVPTRILAEFQTKRKLDALLLHGHQCPHTRMVKRITVVVKLEIVVYHGSTIISDEPVTSKEDDVEVGADRQEMMKRVALVQAEHERMRIQPLFQRNSLLGQLELFLAAGAQCL